MRFSSEAERFMRLGCDRLVSLAGLLASLGLDYSVLRSGEARNLLVRPGKGKAGYLLVAHYDRVALSPGALDNSCACIQLASFAAREAARADGLSPFLFAFTDAEESPGLAGAGSPGGAASQGSFALAKAFVSALSREQASVRGAFVLDVTGRGQRLLLSTSPIKLLERNGLSSSSAASGYRGLLELARRAASLAGLEPPLEAELPWSDDLGLTLGGLPSLALSLLPKREAEMLAAGKRPPTWELLHSPEDRPELAEEASFEVMGRFLAALGASLPPTIA
jgi:hypothetical protein